MRFSRRGLGSHDAGGPGGHHDGSDSIGGGVTISRTADAFDPAQLTEVAALVERHRGGVLSSGMEYSGRYTRWHLAYVNPPVEIACRGREVTVRALNERGRMLMPVIADGRRRVGTEVAHDTARRELRGERRQTR